MNNQEASETPTVPASLTDKREQLKETYRKGSVALRTLWHANDENSENVGEVNDTTKSSMRFGFIISIGVLLTFGLWAGLAPLDSAAIAQGSVALYSQKKTMQHFEGGIIEAILVKEGDLVTRGQELVYLNNSAAKSRQGLIVGQLRSALATEARLTAELEGQDFISYPKEIEQVSVIPDVKKIIDGQNRLFETRRTVLEEQISILRQRIEQFAQQVVGIEAQRTANEKQLVLIREEFASKQELLEKGWVNKPEVLALQRTEASLEGQRGQYIAEVAKIDENVQELELQIVNLRNNAMNDALTELKDTQSQIADLREQLQASSDVLERTVIVAPQSGKVTGLQFHTIGGVIGAGEPIMDIVPQDERMIIESKMNVTDIDVVYQGLDAKVMLSAYKARSVPRLNGKVIDVSADRFVDETTKQPYYVARVEIPDSEIERLSANVELYPGMPAEVFIVTGESTFLEYLFDPITSSFRRAFKEQ